jgi:hypothetical protein
LRLLSEDMGPHRFQFSDLVLPRSHCDSWRCSVLPQVRQLLLDKMVSVMQQDAHQSCFGHLPYRQVENSNWGPRAGLEGRALLDYGSVRDENSEDNAGGRESQDRSLCLDWATLTPVACCLEDVLQLNTTPSLPLCSPFFITSIISSN